MHDKKHYFQHFLLAFPLPTFPPQFLMVLVRLVSTLDDCPFPVTSLCAY